MCDNKEVFGAIFSVPSPIKDGSMIFRNLEMAPFTRQAVDQSEVGEDGLLIICSYYSWTAGTAEPTVNKFLRVILETVAPYLSTSLWKNRDDSQLEMRTQVVRMLRGNNTLSIRTLVEGAAKILDQSVCDVSSWTPAAEGDNGGRMPLRQENLIDGLTLTNLEAMHVLTKLAAYADYDTRYTASASIALAVCAFVKNGYVTKRWVDQFIASLGSSGRHYRDVLTVSNIQLVWDTLSETISYQDIEKVVARWMNLIPVSFISLRVQLFQLVEYRFTPQNTIQRALRTYPSYPWTTILMLFPHELQASFAMDMLMQKGREADQARYGMGLNEVLVEWNIRKAFEKAKDRAAAPAAGAHKADQPNQGMKDLLKAMERWDTETSQPSADLGNYAHVNPLPVHQNPPPPAGQGAGSQGQLASDDASPDNTQPKLNSSDDATSLA